MSLRSKSPEDSSSLFSESAGSIDSMLNHSREEEEIRAIMDHNTDCDVTLDNDISDVGTHDTCNCTWEESSINNSTFNQSNDLQINNLEMKRLSNADSGYVSLHSQRNSSYSKRSSQQSSISAQWNVQQQSKQSNVFSEVKSESISQNFKNVTESHSIIKNSIHSYSQRTSNSSVTSVSNFTGGNLSISGVNEVDCVGDGVPPALPQKTKKKQERQPSPYDNVPEANLGNLYIDNLISYEYIQILTILMHCLIIFYVLFLIFFSYCEFF